ncbi:hypothetical protein H5399_14200 [Tessaracoccus sp. MC1627]|uniref:hypothetical protein n=1 Tax=Tessaracoccus sp. MC1627 TaxID=2760312 RepID=UPI001601D2DF|nr:hypothetical protein [Tessaracoccus sp. MC1627]MBB1513747.1 hypothetical protein [Tessaracoccus sp. MC1627]
MSPLTLRRWALPFAALLAVGLSGLAPTASADETAVACVEAGNVWVHVEHEEVTGACATEFASATEAMVSTGLATDQGAFFITVDGVTAQDPQWWSLWTASVEDGELGEWVFAQVGAGDLVPEAGQVIGWRLLADYNQPQEAPQYNPLADEAAEPENSSAAPSESSPSAAPDSSSAAPEASTSPTASADASAPATDAEAEEPASGVPTGTIIGIGVVVALAAAGGLVWWRRRGQ